MINKVSLLGNVGKDAELRSFDGGSIVSFSLATSKSFKKGDSWEEKTTWHNIKYFSKNDLSNTAARVIKGATVYVDGEIETREHEGKYYTDIRANLVRVIGGEKKSNAQPIAVDDDLPF